MVLRAGLEPARRLDSNCLKTLESFFFTSIHAFKRKAGAKALFVVIMRRIKKALVSISLTPKHLAVLAILVAPKAFGAVPESKKVLEGDASVVAEAADLIKQMEAAGVLRVEPNTGKIILTKSLLELLKLSGSIKSSDISEEVAGSCNSTEAFTDVISK